MKIEGDYAQEIFKRLVPVDSALLQVRNVDGGIMMDNASGIVTTGERLYAVDTVRYRDGVLDALADWTERIESKDGNMLRTVAAITAGSSLG